MSTGHEILQLGPRCTGKTIGPGEDRELCEIVKLPGDPDQRYHVDRFELAMTSGSHHLIVAAIRSGSDTEAQVAEGDVIDCVGPTGFGEEIEFVTGSQLPGYEEAYPEGVGKVYRGGQYLVLNYHYRWGTDFPVELAGGARDGEQVDVSPSYEEPDHVFDRPMRVAAGEGFRFTCNYINTTSQTLEFGVKATDEMCILFGLVYSPVDREVPDQICVVDTEAE